MSVGTLPTPFAKLLDSRQLGRVRTSRQVGVDPCQVVLVLSYLLYNPEALNPP